MFPFQPPFPTEPSFPFQFDAGSHTSILISESLDGFSVAAIRQNAGRSANAAPPPRPPPPAGAKAPAATDCARVIVVSGSLSDDRFSHVAAAAGIERRTSNTGIVNNKTDFLIWAPRLIDGKLATNRHKS